MKMDKKTLTKILDEFDERLIDAARMLSDKRSGQSANECGAEIYRMLDEWNVEIEKDGE
jgi:hypothetical protein